MAQDLLDSSLISSPCCVRTVQNRADWCHCAQSLGIQVVEKRSVFDIRIVGEGHHQLRKQARSSYQEFQPVHRFQTRIAALIELDMKNGCVEISGTVVTARWMGAPASRAGVPPGANEIAGVHPSRKSSSFRQKQGSQKVSFRPTLIPRHVSNPKH